MTKEIIVQHAAKTFLSNGYKTVTMDEVASDLGVSKKTLYEIFGNKEGLIRLSLKFQFQELREVFEDALSLNLDAISEMHFIMDKIRSKIGTLQHKNAVYQLQKYYAKIYRKVYVEQVVFIQKALETNIEKGQDSGLYRKDVNASDLAEILIQVQSFLRSNEKSINDTDKMEYLSNVHFNLMLRGMATPAGIEKLTQLVLDTYEK